jgi:hypothetical protein
VALRVLNGHRLPLQLATIPAAAGTLEKDTRVSTVLRASHLQPIVILARIWRCRRVLGTGAASVPWPGCRNVAVTVSSAFVVTMHDCVPEQPAPLQPTNVEPNRCGDAEWVGS